MAVVRGAGGGRRLATAGTAFVSFFVQTTETETTRGEPSNRTDVHFNSIDP